MANIYQLTREYNDLYELALANADEETGELDERITSALDIKGAELETKGISVACVVKRLNATADEIDSEIERLTKMKKAIQSTTERLKDGLKAAWLSAGIVKTESVKATISFRKSEQVAIDNEADLPEEYKREIVTIKPDKTAIKAAIKEGKEIPGAHIEECINIQIK